MRLRMHDNMEAIVIDFDCSWGDVHSYPDDWRFGGADDTDPRSDPRWLPTTYRYLDATLEEIWRTQTPLCDEQALDEFTLVATQGRNMEPVYIEVRRPKSTEFELLDWSYDKATDLLSPFGESSHG